MSGVTFRIEQQSDKRVVLYLEKITPRMMIEIHKALKMWIYMGASLSQAKYFAGSQSVKRGAPNTGSLLVSRTGTLRRSIAASVDAGMEPSAPGPNTTTITAQWGAATPYARIQELGGYAGRSVPSGRTLRREITLEARGFSGPRTREGYFGFHRPYLPARPYLSPALKESQGKLHELIQAAVNKAIESSA